MDNVPGAGCILYLHDVSLALEATDYKLAAIVAQHKSKTTYSLHAAGAPANQGFVDCFLTRWP